MRENVRATLIAVPIAIVAGLLLGSTTVSAMQVSAAPVATDAAAAPPDRYALGQSWATRHHTENPDACPSIDLMFQSGCIAATRY